MRQTQHPITHGWRGVLQHLIQHVRDDWPATVFVAAVFAVIHNNWGWFDAIDGYAFVAIGNIASHPALRPAESPTYGAKDAKALVVMIDRAAAEARYLDRAPLDRCRLREDLAQVYTAMATLNRRLKDRHEQKFGAHTGRLDVLIVDLDISPALWLTTEAKDTGEAACEEELYKLIENAAKNQQGASPVPIRTVLMTPFEPTYAAAQQRQQEWLETMKRAGVRFGRAGLPLDYGLVIKQYCDPGSLAGAAHLWIPSEQNKCVRETLEKSRPPTSRRELIDPRKYLGAVVPIAIGDEPDEAPGEVRPFGARLSSVLGTDQPSISETNFRAVFFGAAFGEGDTFVTPLGELYGVEVHAAGLLSFMDPPSTGDHFSQLLLDIAFGFVFGVGIAFCWDRYFKARLHDDANRRLLAPFYVFVLGGWVLFWAVFFSIVSLWLLASRGIWLSPIPIAIGMLIESFVSGSAAQGIREANKLMKQGRPPSRTFAESFRRFFYDDIRRLSKKKPLAAAIVALRLAVWTGVVGWALVGH